MRRILVKKTPETRAHCIAGLRGYVERAHEDGTVSVCVYDSFDGGLCGPFRIPAEAVGDAGVKRENVPIPEPCAFRDPNGDG